jgi:hypothetical protein
LPAVATGIVKEYRANGDVAVANSRSIKPSPDESVVVVSDAIGDRNVAKQVVRMAIERSGRIETSSNNAGSPSPEPAPGDDVEGGPATPACQDAWGSWDQ